jgi:hypothetical protein
MLSCMLCLLWHALKGLVKGDAGMHCEGLRGIGAIVARLVGNAIGFCALAVNGSYSVVRLHMTCEKG